MYTVGHRRGAAESAGPLAAEARVVLSQTWSALAAELDLEN